MICGGTGSLQMEELRSLFADGVVTLEYQETVDSTNEWAKRAFRTGARDASVFLADHQSAGKGRLGRSWTSPEYTSISMSLLLRPQVSLECLPMLTLVMGLSAAEGMREPAGLDIRIKWPNDVICRGRKLCGILTEFVSSPDGQEQAVVIGIGINVNVPSFPEELSDKATSLLLETGRPFSREEIIRHILRAFQRNYLIFRQTGDMSGLIGRYSALLSSKEKEVRIMEASGAWEGVALGVDNGGRLLVRRRDTGKVEAVFAGEVSVRGLLGYA